LRTLYYVPIIMHSLEELGSLAEPLLKIEKQIHGPEAEKIYREKVDQYWATITQCLEEEGLNVPEKCKKMHIYVDGLTAQPFYCKTCFDKTGKKRYMDEIASNKVRCSFCERVVEAAVEEFVLKLVKFLIEEGIRPYLIIEKLMERGAKIHGTESQALLVEEHNLWVNIAKGINAEGIYTGGIDTNVLKKIKLLIERDKFIAETINQTLPKDEVGILFIGAAHKVDDELKKFPDIKIIPFGGGD